MGKPHRDPFICRVCGHAPTPSAPTHFDGISSVCGQHLDAPPLELEPGEMIFGFWVTAAGEDTEEEG